MPPNKPERFYDILIGPKVKVTVDRKSKARIANFPFEFPDGTNGLMILLRVKDEDWVPVKDIRKLSITFNE